MNLPSLHDITEKGLNAFKRFPVTLVWAILGTFYFIYLINNTSNGFNDKITIFITLVLGVSWLIGTQFFIEQTKEPKKWIWLKLLVLLLLFAFYWHLPEPEHLDKNPKYLIRFFLYIIAGHIFVFLAAFIKKWNKAAYWNYLITIGASISRSILFSGVLYLGLVLALVAIDALFDVHIKGERYGQLFIFCAGIVNTWIYLADFPKNIHEHTVVHMNKALEVFVKYILIPLVLLYIIILYAYSFKIIYQWELPKGWVSYLVTALALLGFLVQVIINPIQNTVKSWMINQFYPWFYRFLLPLIALLFVAIFRRITDYGITENRYFVVTIAIWILAMMLYLLISKKKRLIVLPSSLLIITLLVSFGFWGAISVSKNSQLNQFKKIFENVKANNHIASSEEYQQLNSILDYLDDRESISKLDKVTNINMYKAFKDTTLNSRWLDTGKVLDSLGIIKDPNAITTSSYGDYYSYYSNPVTYDINSYQYMREYDLNNYDKEKVSIGKYEIQYNSKTMAIELVSKDTKTVSLDMPLEKKLKALIKKYGDNFNNTKKKELIFTAENDSINLKVIISHLTMYNKNDTLDLSNSRTFVLLKQN